MGLELTVGPELTPEPSLTPEPRAELTVGPGIAQAPASEPLEPSAADWGAEKVDVEIEVDIPTEGDFGAEWGEPELTPEPEISRPRPARPPTLRAEPEPAAVHWREIFEPAGRRRAWAPRAARAAAARRRLLRVARVVLSTHRSRVGLTILDFLEGRGGRR